mmetsp:Transcript_30343/g.96830  ORF Transcript_30343/g.96830 Transcript_30343/m.96830 type:complete len:222 (-) Transcript_30343:450-1115(-)
MRSRAVLVHVRGPDDPIPVSERDVLKHLLRRSHVRFDSAHEPNALPALTSAQIHGVQAMLVLQASPAGAKGLLLTAFCGLSMHRRVAGPRAGCEQVPELLLIHLNVCYSQRVSLGRVRTNAVEEAPATSWDDAVAGFVAPRCRTLGAEHGVGFPRPGLAVGEDGAMVAADEAINNGRARVVEDDLLAVRRAEAAVVCVLLVAVSAARLGIVIGPVHLDARG